MDIDYNYHKCNTSYYLNYLTGIFEPIISKIETSEEHLIKIESSHLGNNI